MTSRTLLTDLIHEIAAVTEYHEPEPELRPTDTIFTRELPEEIKKLWTLRWKYSKESYLNQIANMSGLITIKDAVRVREVEFKASVLDALFWQAFSLLYPQEKQMLIGIRKGWIAVIPSQKAPVTEESLIDVSAPSQIN